MGKHHFYCSVSLVVYRTLCWFLVNLITFPLQSQESPVSADLLPLTGGLFGCKDSCTLYLCRGIKSEHISCMPSKLSLYCLQTVAAVLTVSYSRRVFKLFCKQKVGLSGKCDISIIMIGLCMQEDTTAFLSVSPRHRIQHGFVC